MFFCWDITISAGTLIDEPMEVELNLPHGIVTRVDVKFPAGCHGMVGVRLFSESLQAVPLTEDEYVTGDDETIPTETYIELFDEPYKLKFQGCSPNCDYDHTVTVRINVSPEENAGIITLVNLIRKILARVGINIDR